ncbi:MAG: VIT domain-containing protein, partial [Deltaproteobacteria bacterium]|nr:VIT domain-containing protein [Deltaproteobacteria bacterium]
MFKSFRTFGVILTLLVTGLLTTALIPGEKSGGSGKPDAADKTLAPYFVVLSDDPKVDALPLKSTRADVKIAGVVAEVKITQVYRNTGQKTLEAIYVFPMSTRAAVHAMRMTIGERVVDAKIMERQKARETYDAAKKEGKTASLLEQQRPNVFQMNLANILPNDEIKVELKYMELLIPEDHIYEFVYPTVAGPR